MRNPFRTSRDVVISGRVYRAAVRILGDDDQLQSTPFNLQGKEKLRLTLPPVGWWAGVSPLTLWVLVSSCLRNMPDSRAEPALAVGSPCRNRALQLGLPSVHVGERDSGGEGVFPSFPPGAVFGRYIQKVTPQISLAVFSQPSKVRPPSILILPSSCPEPAITGSGRGGSMLG